ncbi:MAG: HDOD domain-containing protein [Desulfonatronovibrio sp. MSAO_Bac4]|nr:MAG: HDOD domain-containing protein [Desulfonatronovibrio sp. MSAO_Bac4]
MTTILFVDDEINVLNGIRRMLRNMRGEWDMHFATSGDQALQIMSAQNVDVIVTDMRMPGMHGGELLTKVMKLWPETIRMVLSGHSDLDVVYQAVLPAHQYISKPSSAETIKSAIQRAIKVRKHINGHPVKAVISSLDTLPALPELYHQLTEELRKSDPDIKAVSRIIAMDIGMSAKLLKLVNSSFFGFCRHIASLEQAVTLLGINIIRSLILSVHIFSLYDLSNVPGFSLKKLWEHCLGSANLAQKLAVLEGMSRESAEDCYFAGLFHDIGKLVLASQLPEEYNAILKKIRNKGLTVRTAEIQILGTSHAEVGGYLLGVWGFPDDIVEAVTFHHQPCLAQSGMRALTTTHVSNILERRYNVFNPNYNLPDYSFDYLKTLQLTDRLKDWEKLARGELDHVCHQKG